MKSKWFYVDITTTCRERVAIKAEDEDEAVELAGVLVDSGDIDTSNASDYVYGSINESIAIAERGYCRPPRHMHKFEGPIGNIK